MSAVPNTVDLSSTCLGEQENATLCYCEEISKAFHEVSREKPKTLKYLSGT